jgi:hypothetical protein
MNVALDGFLTRLGWSPEQFGHHLNEFARCMRLPDVIHPKTPGGGSRPDRQVS